MQFFEEKKGEYEYISFHACPVLLYYVWLLYTELLVLKKNALLTYKGQFISHRESNSASESSFNPSLVSFNNVASTTMQHFAKS